MSKVLCALAVALVTLACPLRAAGPGDEVIVVYNRGLRESKSLAEYYAKQRRVP